MKNENVIREAIDDLEHGVEVGNIIFQMPEDEEIIAIIMVALKRQIPMKVSGIKTKVKAFDAEENQIYWYDCLPCPSCNKWISKLDKYCPYCGQRLDWE